MSTGAIAIAPAIQPINKATCCFHGVAPTSKPVFKSCKLSLEIAAILVITLVIKIANAVASKVPYSELNKPARLPNANTTREETMIPKIPIPEIGLEEVPIRPAM